MSLILSICKQRGVARIELEDAPALRIPAPLLRERPLRVGERLDMAQYLEWIQGRAYRFALDTAVAYLAARPRTTREVSSRLDQAGYDEQTCDRVVSRLAQEGYLNDVEFAGQWTLSRTDRALGSRRIAQELQKKGIDRDTIASALSLVDEEDQLRAAAAHAEKLLARTRGKDERDVRRKVQAALARRGYDWDTVRAAMDRVGAEAAEEWEY